MVGPSVEGFRVKWGSGEAVAERVLTLSSSLCFSWPEAGSARFKEPRREEPADSSMSSL